MTLTPALVDLWRHVLLHLWQTTLVVIPVLIAAYALRRASAWIVHGLWLVALAKLALPLALLGTLSSQLAHALFGTSPSLSSAPALATIGTVRAMLDPIEAVRLSLTPSTLVSALVIVITVTWLAIAAHHVLNAISRAQRDARAVGAPARSADDPQARRVMAAAEAVRVRRHTIALTSDGAGARVVGLMKPVIVLPGDLVDTLSDSELRAVLLHEDAHRRRRDPLRMLTVELAASLFRFYPLLGPIVRGLRRSAELVCDTSAIARGADPTALARALARSALHALPAHKSQAAAFGGHTPLAERLERIKEPERYKSMRKHRLTLTMVAVAAAIVSFAPVPFMVGCTQAEDEPAATASAPEEESVSDSADAFDTPPVAITQRAPVFPKEARESVREGKVYVRVTIDETGAVTNAVVEKRSDDDAAVFDEASLTAAREWTFEPARRGDEPVKCQIVIPFQFKIE